MESSNHFDMELKKANEDMTRCLKVETTVQSPGWQEIIEPLLDKMLMDIVGGKVNGKWYGGLLDRAKKDERREYYIGYKQALIDLHGRVMAFPNGIKQLQTKLENLKKSQIPRYKLPLVDDTRYNNAVRG